MQACIRNKQTGKALEIFRELKAKKEPIYDSTLFTTLIIGCAHSYSITQGTQLIKEAFDHQLDISPETVQTLISAAFRKRTAPDMGQLQELVKQYNLPMTAAIHSRLFA
jgi:pentatricopeptide repeat protein